MDAPGDAGLEETSSYDIEQKYTDSSAGKTESSWETRVEVLRQQELR